MRRRKPWRLGAAAVVRLVRTLALGHARGSSSFDEQAGTGRPRRKYTGAASTQDKGVDNRKSVKTPPRARVVENRRCYSAARFPPGDPGTVRRRTRRQTLPEWFSTVVERSCGYGMSIAFSEHDGRVRPGHMSWSGPAPSSPKPPSSCGSPTCAPVELTDDVLALAVPSQLVRERLQHNHLHLIERGGRRSGRPPREDPPRGGRGPAPTPGQTRRARGPRRAALRPPAPRSAPATGRRPGAAPDHRSARPACRSPTTRSTRSCPDPSTGSRTPPRWPSPRRRRPRPTTRCSSTAASGLGKTHLLIAVGHHMYRLHPGAPREVRDLASSS